MTLKEQIAARKAEHKKIVEARAAEKYDKNLARKKTYNLDLVNRYPFLMPRDYSGKVVSDYDYTYTILDDMPEGWKNAFGVQMCEDIKQVLIKGDCLKEYRILEIKEKYGELRWYDWGATSDIHEELTEVIDYYTALSQETCIMCGKPATRLTIGWVMPVCDKCAKKTDQPTKVVREYK